MNFLFYLYGIEFKCAAILGPFNYSERVNLRETSRTGRSHVVFRMRDVFKLHVQYIFSVMTLRNDPCGVR